MPIQNNTVDIIRIVEHCRGRKQVGETGIYEGFPHFQNVSLPSVVDNDN